jgi:choline dehydrogenase-like flavoprotein
MPITLRWKKVVKNSEPVGGKSAGMSTAVLIWVIAEQDVQSTQKQSTLVTTIPGALKAGATLISKARAEDFVLTKGKITELKCRAMTPRGNVPSGRLIKIKASHYVLAAGAIGSPAILLAFR